MLLRDHRPLRPDLCKQAIDLDAIEAPIVELVFDLRGETSDALFRGGFGVGDLF